MQNASGVDSVAKLAASRWWPTRKKKFTPALVNDVYDIVGASTSDEVPQILDVLCMTKYFENVLADEAVFDGDITNTHLDLILMLAIHNGRVMSELIKKETQFELLIERLLSMTIQLDLEGTNPNLVEHIFCFLRKLAAERLYTEPVRQLFKELVPGISSDTDPDTLRAKWLPGLANWVQIALNKSLKEAKPILIRVLSEIVQFFIVLDCQLPLRVYAHDFIRQNHILDIWNAAEGKGVDNTVLAKSIEFLRYFMLYPINMDTGEQVTPSDRFDEFQGILFNQFQHTQQITDIPSKYDTDRDFLCAQLSTILNKDQLLQLGNTLGLEVASSLDIDILSRAIASLVIPPDYSVTQYFKHLADPFPLYPYKFTLFPTAQYMTIHDYMCRNLHNGISSIKSDISDHLSQVFNRLGSGFKGKSKYFLPVINGKGGLDIGKGLISQIVPDSWVMVVTWGKINKYSDDIWTSKYGVLDLQIGQINGLDKKIVSIRYLQNNYKLNDEKSICHGLILMPKALQSDLKFYERFEFGIPGDLSLPDFLHDSFLGYQRDVGVLLFKNVKYRLDTVYVVGATLAELRPTKRRKGNEGIVDKISYSVERTREGDRNITETAIPGFAQENCFDIDLLESCINPGVTVVSSSLSWDYVPQFLRTLHVNLKVNLPQERHIILVPDNTPQLIKDLDVYQESKGYEEWVTTQIQEKTRELKTEVLSSLPDHLAHGSINQVLAAFDVYIEPRWNTWIKGECKEPYPFDDTVEDRNEAREHYLKLVSAFEELEKLRIIGKLDGESLLRYLRDTYCRTVILEESRLVELGEDVEFDSVILWGQSVASFIVNYQLILTNKSLKRIIVIDNDDASASGLYMRLLNMGVKPIPLRDAVGSTIVEQQELKTPFATRKGYIYEADSGSTSTQYSIKEVQMCAALYRYLVNNAYESDDVVVICSSPVHVQLLAQNYEDVRAIEYRPNLAQHDYVIWSTLGALEPVKIGTSRVESKASNGFYAVSTTIPGRVLGVPRLQFCGVKEVANSHLVPQDIGPMQLFIDKYL